MSLKRKEMKRRRTSDLVEKVKRIVSDLTGLLEMNESTRRIVSGKSPVVDTLTQKRKSAGSAKGKKRKKVETMRRKYTEAILKLSM